MFVGSCACCFAEALVVLYDKAKSRIPGHRFVRAMQLSERLAWLLGEDDEDSDSESDRTDMTRW